MPEDQIDRLEATPRVWDLIKRLAATAAYDARIVGQGIVPEDRLSTLRQPTLVMAGAESPGWLQAGARAVAQAVPNGRFAVLDGQAHQVAGGALAAELIPFLRDNTPA